MYLKHYFAYLALLILISCKHYKHVPFTGTLMYDQQLTILNDSLDNAKKHYYESLYSDTFSIHHDGLGNLKLDGNGRYLGLDFHLKIASRPQSANALKSVDSLHIVPYDHKKRKIKREQLTYELYGLEQLSLDSGNNYPYLLEYTFITDSLFFKNELQKNYRDYFFDELLIKANRFPIRYSIETPDFRITRTLLKTEEKMTIIVDSLM